MTTTKVQIEKRELRIIKKQYWLMCLIFLLLVVIIDRISWSSIAQWREDQAVNLWLGYTQNPLEMPVGLISSVNFPNPNGMALISIFLSRLPNLWVVSTVIGVVQAALILWIAWLLFGKSNLFFLFSLPLLVSIQLRATSVEFWNQWILTSINLFFWGLWIYYLRKPEIWKFLLLILPILFAPSIYLAGIVNSVLFSIFVLIALKIAPPKKNTKETVITLIGGVLLIGLSLWITWIPYITAVHGLKLSGIGFSSQSILRNGLLSIFSGISFPYWNISLWTNPDNSVFLQNSSKILSAFTSRLIRISQILLFIQAIIFLIAFSYSVIQKYIKKINDPLTFSIEQNFHVKVLFWGILFVILGYVLSPLVGGPIWANGERIDQQIQFLPFMLIMWFCIPFCLHFTKLIDKVVRGLTVTIGILFIFTNIIIGYKVISENLSYRGDYLSSADVPLLDKLQVVKFIANDWRSISNSKEIPISYDLGGEKWNWVTDFGAQMERWYASPMTLGREFDFQFLRSYGLQNSQEGIQYRTSETSRYIVTYAFLDPPKFNGKETREVLFGRLRVTIVQNQQ